MELRYSRHSSNDTVTAKLSKLLAVGAIYIDEAIHITDAEAMDGVWRMALPLSSESAEYQSTILVYM